MDDIKVGCTNEVRAEFIVAWERVFGKGELDITHDNFTNCGTRHTKTSEGYELDQTEYLKALKPIQHPELTGKKAEESASPVVQQMFHSFVGHGSGLYLDHTN